MTAKKKTKEPTYAELSGELETILDEIESGEIDLDALPNQAIRIRLNIRSGGNGFEPGTSES